MGERGVAIVRGKGMPTRTHIQDRLETRCDFVRHVTQGYEFNLDQRNTLTFEFVWDD